MLLQLAIFIPLLNLDEILCWSAGKRRQGINGILTPMTKPIWTRPGIFLARPDSSLPARRPQSIRAFSSVAISRALKGILLAFKIVSSLEVAVIMWEEPEVREV